MTTAPADTWINHMSGLRSFVEDFAKTHPEITANYVRAENTWRDYSVNLRTELQARFEKDKPVTSFLLAGAYFLTGGNLELIESLLKIENKPTAKYTTDEEKAAMAALEERMQVASAAIAEVVKANTLPRGLTAEELPWWLSQHHETRTAVIA